MKSIQPLRCISSRGRGRSGGRGEQETGRSHYRPVAWVVLLIMVSSLMFAGCGARKGPDADTQAGAKVAILTISPRETDTRTEIEIEGSDQILQYTSFQLTEPLRLIVDITDADLANFKDKIAVNKGPVIDITPSQVDNIARLEIALSQPVETKVYQAGGKLMVELANPVEAAKATPEAVTPSPVPEVSKAAAESASAKVVKSVQATGSKQGAKVVIIADGTMKPNSFMIEGKRLVIDVPGAKSRVRPSVIPVRKGGLDKVRIGQHSTPEQKVRIVLDLTKPMEYTVTPEGNTLVVAMNIATAPKAEEKPQERAAAQPQEAAPAVMEKAEKETPEAAAPVPAAATQEKGQERAEARPHVAGRRNILGNGSKEVWRAQDLPGPSGCRPGECAPPVRRACEPEHDPVSRRQREGNGTARQHSLGPGHGDNPEDERPGL